jgi:two-component system sensor histidine kinase KdpD
MIGVVVRQMRETLGSRPLSINVPDNLPPLVVDEVLMEQALVNVLSNAVKYSPNHSPIHIAAIASPTTLRIEIRDFGMGIDPEDTEKIFEKFYRSPRTQNVPGTGLGLAICQGIAQAHGGCVTATPGSPKGSIFALELPWNPQPGEGEPS